MFVPCLFKSLNGHTLYVELFSYLRRHREGTRGDWALAVFLKSLENGDKIQGLDMGMNHIFAVQIVVCG